MITAQASPTFDQLPRKAFDNKVEPEPKRRGWRRNLVTAMKAIVLIAL